MSAPVLALIGQIPDADIGRDLGHLHEIRDQTGIIARLVDHCALIRKPEAASRLTAKALRAMFTGVAGPGGFPTHPTASATTRRHLRSQHPQRALRRGACNRRNPHTLRACLKPLRADELPGRPDRHDRAPLRGPDGDDPSAASGTGPTAHRSCSRHVAAMTPPVGWLVDDTRLAAASSDRT